MIDLPSSSVPVSRCLVVVGCRRASSLSGRERTVSVSLSESEGTVTVSRIGVEFSSVIGLHVVLFVITSSSVSC
jgi:hypothetical protein